MNFLREIVSGRKKRFKEGGYNLDLTYVSKRIIGMSFPASGIESTYRNHIDDVSKFLKERHGNNFLIFNLSNRKYDYSRFDNQVMDFPWEDHHSPPISTLFECCKCIDIFLKKSVNNVVVVHCLAGKGRTGTAICCYLMYSGRFPTPDDTLAYYAKKRFEVEGLGVTQPSQIRYIHYFYEIFKKWTITPTVKLIESIELIEVPKFNSGNSCRPVIEIINVKRNEKIYKSKIKEKFYEGLENNRFMIKIDKVIPVCGDVLIRVKNVGTYKTSLIARFAFNSAFIQKNNCLPETPFEDKCSVCMMDLETEKPEWEKIYSIMNEYEPPTAIKSKILVFGDPDFDDVEEVISDFKKNSESFLSDGEVVDKNSYESPNSSDDNKEINAEMIEKHRIFEDKIKQIEEEEKSEDEDSFEKKRKRSNSVKNLGEHSPKNKSIKETFFSDKKNFV